MQATVLLKGKDETWSLNEISTIKDLAISVERSSQCPNELLVAGVITTAKASRIKEALGHANFKTRSIVFEGALQASAS